MYRSIAHMWLLLCMIVMLSIALLVTPAPAKASTIDSLLNKLTLAKDDTNKVKLLYTISANYYNTDAEQGVSFGFKSMALAESLKWEKGIGWACNKIGINYWAMSNYDKALLYHKKALAILEKLGDKDAIAQILGNIGIVYGDMGDYLHALEYEQKAIDTYEILGNKIGKLKNLGNIGAVYGDIGNHTKALEYYFKALKIAEEIGDKKGIAINFNNLGTAYKFQENYNRALEYEFKALQIFEDLGEKNSVGWAQRNIGVIYGLQLNYAKALQSYLRALEIFNALADQRGKAALLNDIANTYHLKNNFSKAFEYYFSALAIFEELQSNSDLASTYGSIGMNYLTIAKKPLADVKPNKYIMPDKQANLNLATFYLQKSIVKAKEMDNSDVMQIGMRYLSETYKLSGDYKKAIETYAEFSDLHDSVFSAKSKIAIANLEVIRELDKKEQEMLIKDKQLQVSQLQLAKSRTERFLFLACVVLLVVVVAFVVKNLRSERLSVQSLSKEKKKNLAHIEAQNKVLRQIAFDQSHRIRGSVSTILGLVNLFNHDEPEDPVNKVVIDGVASVTQDLDHTVKDVVAKLNTVS